MADGRFRNLSRRETEVLSSIAAGLTNEAIGRQLHVSVKTVETMCSSVFRKLDLFDDPASNRRVRAARMYYAALDLASGSASAEADRHTYLPVGTVDMRGRESELDCLEELLEHSRLVTVTGIGGVGKTTLALAAGRRWTSGVRFVELASARDADAAQRVADLLGATERAGYSWNEVVASFLRAHDLLLIIDNCEHVLRVVACLVERILEAAPHVTILATSRERLHVPGERVMHLTGLGSLHLPVPSSSNVFQPLVQGSRRASSSLSAWNESAGASKASRSRSNSQHRRRRHSVSQTSMNFCHLDSMPSTATTPTIGNAR